MKQLQIEFSSTVRPHNNYESMMQAVKYEINFNSQTSWLLTQLLAGRSISGRVARLEHGIEDCRARVHTLRKMDIDVKHRTIKGANGAREWYLEESEIMKLTKR